jgi:hypothetical protein
MARQPCGWFPPVAALLAAQLNEGVRPLYTHIMLIDIPHELEVLKAFFAKQVAWVTTEYAKLSSAPNASSRTSEDIETELFHPQGPGSVEDLLCRLTINELNTLIEASLQDTLMRVADTSIFRTSDKKNSLVKLVYTLNRGELENELSKFGVLTNSISGHQDVSAIKEIAEGNKHRQRLMPVPKWSKAEGTLVASPSVIPRQTDEWLSPYEHNLDAVSNYLLSAESFINEIAQIKPAGAA